MQQSNDARNRTKQWKLLSIGHYQGSESNVIIRAVFFEFGIKITQYFKGSNARGGYETVVLDEQRVTKQPLKEPHAAPEPKVADPRPLPSPQLFTGNQLCTSVNISTLMSNGCNDLYKVSCSCQGWIKVMRGLSLI